VVDAGTPAACRDSRDCPTGSFCNYESPGCGAVPGTCRPHTDCSDPEAPLYCGCDGTTLQEVSNCTPHPWRFRGPCPGSPSCAGAAIGPSGHCQGPADGPLPDSCCTGYVCEARQALCNTLPPACLAGEIASVWRGCWGPCVPVPNCAPIPCPDASTCPSGYICSLPEHLCLPGE
jgi:hypothetical protein